MSRFRGWIQQAQLLLTNLPNFIKGGLYQGTGKTVCVPGLVLLCPAASGACPIGAFQAVAGSSRFRFLLCNRLSHFAGGDCWDAFIWVLCPFGWFQELLHKIPTKSSPQKAEAPDLSEIRGLLVMVVLLPALVCKR